MPQPGYESRLRQAAAMRRALWPPLIALIILAVLLASQVLALLTASRWVDRSDAIIASADTTLKLLIDMETGQRGFLLSGDPTFLQPYNAAQPQIERRLDDLEKSVADDTEQSQRVAALKEGYAAWHRAEAEEIAERRAAGGDNVRFAVLFRRATGKQRMDALRNRFADFLQAEDARRRAREHRARMQTRVLFGLGGVCALAFAGLLSVSTRRGLSSLAGEYDLLLDAEQQARERLGTTLNSIGDAVLVTDARGNVTLLNPVAEELAGWTRAEALGQPSARVFDIVNETTRQLVESPIERVIREGIVVGLANHTVLRRRDGKEVAIDDSGAPVRDRNGNLTGVVLVFRDVTRHRQLEAERAVIAEQQKHVAETLQRSLLLVPELQTLPGLDLHAVYRPALDEAEVGGDFFDAFTLGSGRTVLMVGDVTGKGLVAATLTAEVKFALRTLLHEHGGDPVAALARLNRYLVEGPRGERRPEDLCVAMVVCAIDTATETVSIAVAGSEPPMVLRAGSAEASAPDVNGHLLGAWPVWQGQGATLPFGIGDHLILFSDGLTEARSLRRRAVFFGAEGIAHSAQAGCARGGSLVEIGATILADATAFADGELGDDVCLLIARRKI